MSALARVTGCSCRPIRVSTLALYGVVTPVAFGVNTQLDPNLHIFRFLFFLLVNLLRGRIQWMLNLYIFAKFRAT